MKKIYPNVIIGKNTFIEDFVIFGKPPRNKKPGELKTIIGDNGIIRNFTVIYAGNKIGNNFQTGDFVTIRELNEIGDNVSIGTKSDIQHHIVIEDNVRIHSLAFIPEHSILKSGCWIGPKVCFTNAPFPNSPKTKKYLKGPIIEENAKIGANVIVLPKIIIGKNSLVGAGSVVTKNVPENKVVCGNPAKVIKDISELKFKNGEKAYLLNGRMKL